MSDHIDDQHHLSLDELVGLLSDELTSPDVTPVPAETLPLWEVSWKSGQEHIVTAVTAVTVKVRAASAGAALEAALGTTRSWLDASPGLACTVAPLDHT